MPITIPYVPLPSSIGSLAAGYYQKPFPSSSVSVPALTSYQMWFGGVTFGSGTGVELMKVEGLDQPDVRTGDAGRARDAGSFVGLDLLGSRTITVTAQMYHAAGTTFLQTWSNLAAATGAGGTAESPLYVNLPGFGTVLSMCRVRRRQMPIDIMFALGNLVNVTLQFNATDPRLYSAPTLSTTVSPPGTGSGFAFPLSLPLSFGGGSVAGVISAVNAGNVEMRPLLTITGPCTNPSITNASAPGSPNLTFVLSMNAGDQLVIDTDMHTATYYTSGSTTGSTRAYLLAAGSQWFSLLPASGPNSVSGGVNTLQFLTGDSVATGSLTCQAPGAAYVL